MEILAIAAAFLLILVGCVFVFLPGLPGPIVAWCGPFVYFLISEKTLPGVGVGTLAVAGALALLALVFDFVSSWWGAAKFGATWRGGVGALVGAIAGPIIFSPIGGIPGMLLGLIVGPIVGAVAGEFLSGRDFRGSARAGWGTMIGAIAAMVVKLLYCLGVFVWFLGALILK